MISRKLSFILKGFLHLQRLSNLPMMTITTATSVKDNIVISGIVGGFPGNATLEEFYNALLAGCSEAAGTTNFPASVPPPPYMPRGPEEPADPVELTMMVVMDAGVNPSTLRGTNTGIYHTTDGLHKANESARRVARELSFKGPAVDLSSCSGIVSLDLACRAIGAGECDSAVVFHQKFHGSKGDETTCVAMYICRETAARRVYAEIKGTAVNDSNRGVNATENRGSPYLRACAKAGVEPYEVPLLRLNSWTAIEGLGAIAILVLSNINGTIPGGSFSVVYGPETNGGDYVKNLEANTPWEGDIVGISDFHSSSNGYVILSFDGIECQREFFPSDLPTLIPFAARRPKILNHMLSAIANHSDHGMVALIHQLNKQHLRGHAYRGYALNHPSQTSKNQIVTEAPIRRDSDPRILFVMTGTGCHWPGMGRGLMRIPAFAESIQKADKLLEGKFQLSKLIHAGELGEDKYWVPLMVTCIQLALIDLMRSLAIEPTSIIGYSTGEIASAYADGCLSFEETVALIAARTHSFREARLSGGGMAAVSFSWEQATQCVPEGVVPACHNAANNVTVSGGADHVERFVIQMKNQGIHAVPVNTEGIAHHSEYMEPARADYEQRLKYIFRNKKFRQKKWISASLANAAEAKETEFTVVEYFVNKMRSPVRFKEAVDLVPTTSIVIELGPHSMLQTFLCRRFKKVRVIGLTNKKADDQIFHFLESVGKLFNAGANPNLSTIYPVDFPLRCRTSNLSSVIKEA